MPVALAPTIVLVAFDGVEPLDIVGPADVFSRVGRFCGAAPKVVVASPRGGGVATSGGVTFADTKPLQSLKPPFDTVLIAGGDEAAIRSAIDQGVARWIRNAARRARRVGSVCTGAFVLAAAGLLEGKRVVTHWGACEELQRLCPGAVVEPDAIHLIDGAVCTSAGVSAGIDLALALVEHDYGADVAAAIARDMVLFFRRPGGQSQFCGAARAQAGAGDRFRTLIGWILAHPEANLSVPALARRGGMSERHFARTFRAETGATPAAFVLDARLDRAKAMLEQTVWPLKRVAERAGLGSIDSLQRLFHSKMGVAPSDYRARFCARRS